jgi:hypothetical protein
MAEGLIRVALKVLSAYRDQVEPDSIDVDELRQNAPPPQSSWQPDELACFIVQRELASRREPSELEAARAQWLNAIAELNEAIAGVPSGLPHPDGQLRIRRAGAKRAAAYEKYLKLLRGSDATKVRVDEE